MAVNPSRPAAPAPVLKNTATAPVIFCDGAPAFGVLDGVVEVELSARCLNPKPDGSVACDLVCVAHLRMGLNAASNLRDALAKALDMSTAQAKALDIAAQSSEPKH